MNVLHLDEQRGWRGGEQQAAYLIRGLRERGHTCVVAGRAHSAFLDSGQIPTEVPRIAAPFAGELDLWTAWLLASAVRRLQIDVLHAHTSHAHTVACLARLFAWRGKVVVSRRVDFAPRPGRLSRWKYRLPDHFIAISRRVAEVLCEFEVDPGRISVVHSAIDPARFEVEPLPRAALEVPEDAPLLGNVAALVGHKDHATLLDAMPDVLREIPNARLVIAGEGPLRPDLERQIARMGLGGAVRLLGYRNDVPRILRALDGFVLSSKEEGLGTSVLDAMACGVPVVATAAGGIPEMVQHERTGLLAPAQDARALAAAVVRILRDKGLARALAENARGMVLERFTTEAMVAGNLRVYEGLV